MALTANSPKAESGVIPFAYANLTRCSFRMHKSITT